MDGDRPVSATLWLVTSVVSVGVAEDGEPIPYSTREVAGSLVVQVTVAVVGPVGTADTLPIAGGVVSLPTAP